MEILLELLKNVDINYTKILKELFEFSLKQYKDYKDRKLSDVDYLILTCIINDLNVEFQNGTGKKELFKCIKDVSENNMINDWMDLILYKHKINKYVDALVENNMLPDENRKKYLIKLEKFFQKIVLKNPSECISKIENRTNLEERLKNLPKMSVRKVIRSYPTTAIKDIDYIDDGDILNLTKYFPDNCKTNLEKQDDIKSNINQFLDDFMYVNVDLFMETLFSIAFYTGKLIYDKRISEVNPMQAPKNKGRAWENWGNAEYCNVDLLIDGGYKHDNGKLNVVVSFLSNNDIELDVKRKQSLEDNDNILSFHLKDMTVKNGSEAYSIADEIIGCINKEKSKTDKNVEINLYIAGPIVIAYYLGYCSYGIRNINIFEYNVVTELYELSLTI